MVSLNSKKQIREGLIFIPDISGFTELVHSTDVLTGQQITAELLSVVIDQNVLQLKIAEIEGDAVLFYRYGDVPCVAELTSQYEKMVEAFEYKREELEKRFSMRLDLSLKIIAHYGSMTSYRLGAFEKLYGGVVVEAHRLLKNSIECGSYLLVTDALMKKAGSVIDEGIRSNKLCEVYGSLRNICFSYWEYGEVV
jgi:hypothetical protein